MYTAQDFIKSKAYGNIPALATPLKKNGDFDSGGMKNLVNYVIDSGMNSLFVLGFAGEVLSFDKTTRCNIIETVKKEAKSNISVIAGVFDNCTKSVLENIADAKACGADFALCSPPNFYPLTQEEIKSFYLTIADKGILPIIMYNCPLNRHYLSPELVSELARHPMILALKETSSQDHIQRMILKLRGINDFVIMSGDEFVYYPAMSLGIKSFIMGGPGNILPRQCNDILSDYKKGDTIKAIDSYLKMIDFLYELYKIGSCAMAAVKGMLEIMGICSRWMSHPVRCVSDEEIELIGKLIDKRGV